MPALPPEHATTRRIRAFLLAILTVGVLGTAAELYLLEHYTPGWQLTPVVLLGLSVPLVAACWIRPAGAVVRTLQVLMIAFVVAGAVGVNRHFSNNKEFELEIFPDLSGSELAWSALEGAVPVLAPGSLSLLGLIGLAYAYRHPSLASGGRYGDSEQPASS